MVPTWSKNGPDMNKKWILTRNILYTILTQSSKFQSPSWLGNKARPNMVPKWSQYDPDMVPKSTHSIEMFLRPYLPSLENFRALADLEV